MKRLVIGLVVAGLMLSACAAGANEFVDVADVDGDVAGFWMGLWHGLITPITFIISLFTDNVNIYEVHNSGNWYDLGYALGLGTSIGGGPSARSARKR